jgi:hypothetical protein
MTADKAIAFVKEHGVVLERSHGPVPCLVEAIAGEPIRGSWWSHPRGRQIFRVLGAVADSPDILRCRLVNDKITYAHRRVWPALVRLSEWIGPRPLDRHDQVHTPTGAHRTVTTPFPTWVPAAVNAAARRIDENEALATLAPLVPPIPERR